MSSIGHELQHAFEVLSNRALTTGGAIYLFYSREHSTMGDSFETGEAREPATPFEASSRLSRDAGRAETIFTIVQHDSGN